MGKVGMFFDCRNIKTANAWLQAAASKEYELGKGLRYVMKWKENSQHLTRLN